MGELTDADMKASKHNPMARQAALGAGTLGLLLCLAGPSVLRAQSAESLVPRKSDSGSGNGKVAEQYEPDPVDSRPSRSAGQDIVPYIASRAAVFSIRNRAVDPFGLSQDPNAKPIVKKIVQGVPVKRLTALPPTPLKDIVKLIRVTTIMPGEKKFLVGVREFSESDQFPLLFDGKRMNMKVLEVSSRSILFQNLDNGDTASLETDMLPPGMIAGGDRMQPPGLVSPLANLPLELGSGNSPETKN